MSPPQRTTSTDSADGGLRKRVCKACDRCRLKKSKCDGSSPCSRCKADNAICVFGERKKAHDKVYPKGYVEMLEQQQNQLVEGLQEMYRRLVSANAWTGPVLSESNGHPLTHDILAALNLLETKHDGSGETEMFEEDCSKLQSRLLAEGAGYVQRRGSFSSDSEHSHHSGHTTHSRSNSQSHKPLAGFQQSPPSSLPQSPQTKQSPSQHLTKLQILQQHAHQQSSVRQSSPLRHDSPITNDLPVFQTPWADSRPFNLQQPPAPLRMPEQNGLPDLDSSMFEASQFEEAMAFDGYNSMMMTSNSMAMPMPMQYGGCDFSFDPMEFELNKYVAVQ